MKLLCWLFGHQFYDRFGLGMSERHCRRCGKLNA